MEGRDKVIIVATLGTVAILMAFAFLPYLSPNEGRGEWVDLSMQDDGVRILVGQAEVYNSSGNLTFTVDQSWKGITYFMEGKGTSEVMFGLYGPDGTPRSSVGSSSPNDSEWKSGAYVPIYANEVINGTWTLRFSAYKCGGTVSVYKVPFPMTEPVVQNYNITDPK